MKIVYNVILILFFSCIAVAERNLERPVMIIEPRIEVVGGEIYIGDIASFHTYNEESKEIVKKISAIRLAEAPPPRMSDEMIGALIISKIESEGISTDKIAYSIPQTIRVTRKGRNIEKNEVLNAVREQVAKNSEFDLRVRDVQINSSHSIPLGKTDFRVELLGVPSSGSLPLRVAVFVEEKPVARFIATGVVDDWRETPVTSRVLERGSLISESDIQLVRVNLSDYPRDTLVNKDDVVGRLVTGRINAGEVIRESRIDVPPTISRGSVVTMVYKNGIFEATASGVALEDGLRGETIRVRNDRSRNVVRGKVVSKEIIEVF